MYDSNYHYGRNNLFAVKQCEDLKVKYNDEMTQRKKLFNEVQEAKGLISRILKWILFCTFEDNY